MVYNIGSKKLLNQRIIPNPKYRHVRSVIDTGSSITKYMQHIENITSDFKYRRNELFKRMKIVQFVELITQFYNVNSALNRIDQNEITETSQKSSPLNTAVMDLDESVIFKNLNKEEIQNTSSSNFVKFSRGLGEMDEYSPDEDQLKNLQNEPYLLLDVRNKNEFDAIHIRTAQNFPLSLLSRANHFETNEMRNYKNKENAVIIICDYDESLAPKVAETLYQRGYDNIVMLSGGLKVTRKLFRDIMLEGALLNKETIPKFEMTEIEILTKELENIHTQTEKNSMYTTRSRISKFTNYRKKIDTNSMLSRKTIDSKPPFKV
ncbi:Centrosomal protein [Intoshia linei]|uniref:Centrosomal protein n=1 Tax=Intoshia linei TaxID=1819745 RepID=A0A177BCG5_9BILA|nr:Centrosomal protein [Intoshia linei]